MNVGKVTHSSLLLEVGHAAIYRAVPSTFVNVESMRDRLVANNDKTYWRLPSCRKRFHNWPASANDKPSRAIASGHADPYVGE